LKTNENPAQSGIRFPVNRLKHFQSHRFKQGQIAITTGGDRERRAIIHPAVIDLDENRYPTAEVVRSVVRRSLECSVAIGAQSVSFPVLGGGTASKFLKPTESVRTLTTEVPRFLKQYENDPDGLSHVALYIFDPADADGLTSEMKSAREETQDFSK
jgi:O-acetyl-ADP-ribose deacetylase (regulator of RNase III)